MYRSACRALSLLALVIFITPSFTNAQDEVGSRDIKVLGSPNRSLQINQVDTSKFPLVNIFATILEASAPVAGLTANDFKVREDEVEQEPLSVAAQISPLSVVVTIDTSGSMSKAMQTAKEAAQLFVNSLATQDSVAVVSFNRNVQVLANPGTSREGAKQTIAALQARGDTALFDAIHASLDILKSRSGRKAVVLLSDGVDDDGTGQKLSRKSLEDSLKLARELNVPVFTIGLGTDLDEATLQKVASESGASFFKAPTAEELMSLYGKLGQQLTGQYQISYTSNLPGDGTVHNIQLLHGSLRSNKPYSSPLNVAAAINPTSIGGDLSAEATVAAPIPTPPRSIISVVAGVSPENAPLIQLNQRYQIKNPGTPESPEKRLFLAFDCPSGVNVSAIISAKRIKGARDCAMLTWYTAKLSEHKGAYECYAEARLLGDMTISEENKGRCYFELRDVAEATASLTFFSLDDAKSGRDAGMNEATALNLAAGIPVTGNLDKDFDKLDMYSVELAAGTKYQIRARPDLNSEIALTVFDEEGNSLGRKSSQNKGAGVTIDVQPKAAMLVTIGVELVRFSDRTGTYNLVAGEQGVAAPSQPVLNEIPPNVVN